MRQLIIEPDGWPCPLWRCPPGLFVWGQSLCFKSEYSTDASGCDAYNEAGEYFWGGVHTKEDRHAVIVQPVKAEWREIE